MPAARPGGLGATVAGSQPSWVRATVVAALAVAGVAAGPGRPWQGPLAVAVAAALVIALSAHTHRRFGGMTGDVLGAANEVAVTAALVPAARRRRRVHDSRDQAGTSGAHPGVGVGSRAALDRR